MLFCQLREFLAEIFALLRRYLGGLKSRKSALWAEDETGLRTAGKVVIFLLIS